MRFENRRDFLARSGAGLSLGRFAARAIGGMGVSSSLMAAGALAQVPGQRPASPPTGVRVANPGNRVPVSLIIDDSTCLVNLAHFCIPQFQEALPEQFPQPWKTLPREIPDTFVRKFAEWCHEHGVRGKYSLIPYPACVGWLDRDMPGWSRRELEASLELVRTAIVPDWDIHPEIVSHTWVLDTKTGRPYPGRTADFMENWGWSEGKSADQLADYMSYALRILKDVGMPCTGITTPGGFGIRVLPELAEATLQSCRDVFQAEIPHYFRHAFTDDHSVVPRVEYASGLDGSDPKCVVSIVACTGDWFGGWDGLTPGSADQLIAADLKGGRLPEVIARGEPAVIACHWPGIYYNGQEVGFKIFQEVVGRLRDGFDNLVWMKLSEIARYWAARELTRIERVAPRRIEFHAPYACPRFTIHVRLSGKEGLDPSPGPAPASPRLVSEAKATSLDRAAGPLQLGPATFHVRGDELLACFDLPRGRSRLELD